MPGCCPCFSTGSHRSLKGENTDADDIAEINKAYENLSPAQPEETKPSMVGMAEEKPAAEEKVQSKMSSQADRSSDVPAQSQAKLASLGSVNAEAREQDLSTTANDTDLQDDKDRVSSSSYKLMPATSEPKHVAAASSPALSPKGASSDDEPQQRTSSGKLKDKKKKKKKSKKDKKDKDSESEKRSKSTCSDSEKKSKKTKKHKKKDKDSDSEIEKLSDVERRSVKSGDSEKKSDTGARSSTKSDNEDVPDIPFEVPEIRQVGVAPATNTDEFSVVLERQSETKLGMTCAMPQKTRFLVKEIKAAGLVPSWNAKNASKPELQIHPGDIITAVNGIVGNTKEMLKEFHHNVIQMTVQRQTNRFPQVFLKNLDCNIDNETLYEKLNSISDIFSCEVVKDSSGTSRGYGFVRFRSEEAARQGLKMFNGMQIGGKNIEASGRLPISIDMMLGNLEYPKLLADEDLLRAFEAAMKHAICCTASKHLREEDIDLRLSGRENISVVVHALLEVSDQAKARDVFQLLNVKRNRQSIGRGDLTLGEAVAATLAIVDGIANAKKKASGTISIEKLNVSTRADYQQEPSFDEEDEDDDEEVVALRAKHFDSNGVEEDTEGSGVNHPGLHSADSQRYASDASADEDVSNEVVKDIQDGQLLTTLRTDSLCCGGGAPETELQLSRAKKRAQHALSQSAEDGRLLAALRASAIEDGSSPEPEPHVSRAKRRARQLLSEAAEDGHLLGALRRSESPLRTPATELQEVLSTSAGNGQLLAALRSVESPIENTEVYERALMKAKDMLIDSAQSGLLLEALRIVDSPANPPTTQAYLGVRSLLEIAAEDGRLLAALRDVASPSPEQKSPEPPESPRPASEAQCTDMRTFLSQATSTPTPPPRRPESTPPTVGLPPPPRAESTPPTVGRSAGNSGKAETGGRQLVADESAILSCDLLPEGGVPSETRGRQQVAGESAFPACGLPLENDGPVETGGRQHVAGEGGDDAAAEEAALCHLWHKARPDAAKQRTEVEIHVGGVIENAYRDALDFMGLRYVSGGSPCEAEDGPPPSTKDCVHEDGFREDGPPPSTKDCGHEDGFREECDDDGNIVARYCDACGFVEVDIAPPPPEAQEPLPRHSMRISHPPDDAASTGQASVVEDGCCSDGEAVLADQEEAERATQILALAALDGRLEEVFLQLQGSAEGGTDFCVVEPALQEGSVEEVEKAGQTLLLAALDGRLEQAFQQLASAVEPSAEFEEQLQRDNVAAASVGKLAQAFEQQLSSPHSQLVSPAPAAKPWRSQPDEEQRDEEAQEKSKQVLALALLDGRLEQALQLLTIVTEPSAKVEEQFQRDNAVLASDGKLAQAFEQPFNSSHAQLLGQVPVAKPSRSQPDEETDGSIEVVKFELTMANLDYDQLTANADLVSQTKASIRTVVAKEAGFGIEEKHVKVELTKGSVKADVIITPPMGVEPKVVAHTMKSSSTIAAGVASRVANVPGIKKAAAGTISASVTSLPQVTPMPSAFEPTDGNVERPQTPEASKTQTAMEPEAEPSRPTTAPTGPTEQWTCRRHPSASSSPARPLASLCGGSKILLGENRRLKHEHALLREESARLKGHLKKVVPVTDEALEDFATAQGSLRFTIRGIDFNRLEADPALRSRLAMHLRTEVIRRAHLDAAAVRVTLVAGPATAEAEDVPVLVTVRSRDKMACRALAQILADGEHMQVGLARSVRYTPGIGKTVVGYVEATRPEFVQLSPSHEGNANFGSEAWFAEPSDWQQPLALNNPAAVCIPSRSEVPASALGIDGSTPSSSRPGAAPWRQQPLVPGSMDLFPMPGDQSTEALQHENMELRASYQRLAVRHGRLVHERNTMGGMLRRIFKGMESMAQDLTVVAKSATMGEVVPFPTSTCSSLEAESKRLHDGASSMAVANQLLREETDALDGEHDNIMVRQLVEAPPAQALSSPGIRRPA